MQPIIQVIAFLIISPFIIIFVLLVDGRLAGLSTLVHGVKVVEVAVASAVDERFASVLRDVEVESFDQGPAVTYHRGFVAAGGQLRPCT